MHPKALLTDKKKIDILKRYFIALIDAHIGKAQVSWEDKMCLLWIKLQFLERNSERETRLKMEEAHGFTRGAGGPTYTTQSNGRELFVELLAEQ